MRIPGVSCMKKRAPGDGECQYDQNTDMYHCTGKLRPGQRSDREYACSVTAESSSGYAEGQKFYLKDLLYGLMLESYNDCAVAIAEHIAGTTGDFAKLMNDKAEEIGCEDSYFITPNGLDAKNENGFHHTTAADLSLIMRYCIKTSEMAEQFLTITREGQYQFSDIDGKNSYTCCNHNAFLQMMDGALSGKTGFTGNAGYCYVGALKCDDRTFIVALLACGWPNNKTYKWADTKNLCSMEFPGSGKQVWMRLNWTQGNMFRYRWWTDRAQRSVKR